MNPDFKDQINNWNGNLIKLIENIELIDTKIEILKFLIDKYNKNPEYTHFVN